MSKYQVTLNGRSIIFRDLTLGEWGALENTPFTELHIYSKCTLFGVISPEYNQLLPGEILWIGEQIFLRASRFSDESVINSEIESRTATLESSVHIIPAIICSHFPAYKPEEVMKWDFETLVLRLSQIKWRDSQSDPQTGGQHVNLKHGGNLSPEELQGRSVLQSKQALLRELQRHKKG